MGVKSPPSVAVSAESPGLLLLSLFRRVLIDKPRSFSHPLSIVRYAYRNYHENFAFSQRIFRKAHFWALIVLFIHS